MYDRSFRRISSVVEHIHGKNGVSGSIPACGTNSGRSSSGVEQCSRKAKAPGSNPGIGTAAIAQLVERTSCKRDVGRSIRPGGTSFTSEGWHTPGMEGRSKEQSQ